MQTQQNWEFLAATSPYQMAIAIQQLLQEGKLMEASIGLNVLIDSMGRSERRALKSQLVRLITHVIKWKCQPERRSASWAITIRDARIEIEDSQEEYPSLNREYIESIWNQCFSRAVKNAEDEMGKKSQLTSLSWEEVFENEYTLVKPE
jgi:hypothetical protein